MEQSILMWGTIVIYNVAIVQLLRFALARADLKEAMSEKAPSKVDDKITTRTTTTTTPAGLVDDAAAPLVAPVTVERVEESSPSETSYSRVAGMIGAVVLACFVWAVGNVLLYKMLTSPETMPELLDGLGTFFLASASLFAPYALNQLGNAFKAK